MSAEEKVKEKKINVSEAVESGQSKVEADGGEASGLIQGRRDSTTVREW